jgi:hypothetical protein
VANALALVLLSFATSALAQPKLVSPDQGRFRVHGYVEAQIRALADDLQPNQGYLSQWSTILNLEPELDIAPDGWGPFDLISAFARVEVRFECVFSGCGVSDSYKDFGDRSRRSPARNWADADTLEFVGGIDLQALGIPVDRVQQGLGLLNITANPGFQPFYDVGISPDTVGAAFGGLADDVFSWKSIRGPREDIAFPLGPWNFESTIRPIGALANQTSTVSPLPSALWRTRRRRSLPFRCGPRRTASSPPPSPCGSRWGSSGASTRTSARTSSSGTTARARTSTS